MRNTVYLVLATLIALVPCLGTSQVARMEIIAFPSMTLTDQAFLTGAKEGKPVTITGELRLTRPGTDRLPVVILLHGSGGISSYVTDWEQDFNEMGISTFVIDSFSGRGLTTLAFDQSLTGGRLTQLFDLYRAFEVLERHPRVDPSKIVVMGFSRGGEAALYASVKRFQRMHGPASGRDFAAYIALYPTCTAYHDDEEVSSKPIRIFHGASDNYVPVGWCRAYAERLKAKDFDVKHTEFGGAYHLFDWKALKQPQTPKFQTTRNCELREGKAGQIVNAKLGIPFSYADPCVEYGVTIAYDEKASLETRQAVKDLISTLFRP